MAETIDTIDADNAEARSERRSIRRRRDERGEGVISTAIAVLVIAFLGVGMWVGFNQIFGDAVEDTRSNMEQIGR